MKNAYSEDEVKTWIAIIIQGITFRRPASLQLRHHKGNLFVRATVVQDQQDREEGSEPALLEMVISKCRNYRYCPDSEIRIADFGGEWPPYAMMKELDRPKLVGINGGKLDS